jgi:hypothetical protein
MSAAAGASTSPLRTTTASRRVLLFGLVGGLHLGVIFAAGLTGTPASLPGPIAISLAQEGPAAEAAQDAPALQQEVQEEPQTDTTAPAETPEASPEPTELTEPPSETPPVDQAEPPPPEPHLEPAPAPIAEPPFELPTEQPAMAPQPIEAPSAPTPTEVAPPPVPDAEARLAAQRAEEIRRRDQERRARAEAQRREEQRRESQEAIAKAKADARKRQQKQQEKKQAGQARPRSEGSALAGAGPSQRSSAGGGGRTLECCLWCARPCRAPGPRSRPRHVRCQRQRDDQLHDRSVRLDRRGFGQRLVRRCDNRSCRSRRRRLLALPAAAGWAFLWYRHRPPAMIWMDAVRRQDCRSSASAYRSGALTVTGCFPCRRTFGGSTRFNPASPGKSTLLPVPPRSA